jgi:hypothetical protein
MDEDDVIFTIEIVAEPEAVVRFTESLSALAIWERSFPIHAIKSL